MTTGRGVDVARLAPPFTRPRHAFSYVAAVALCLALPILNARLGLTREAVYSSLPNGAGNVAFIHREIFDRSDDIDVLFVGSSVLWAGVDAPLAERELSDSLGRRVNVVSFGTQFWGGEPYYFLVRDVLEHRRVKFVVLQTPTVVKEPDEVPNRWTHRYLRWQDTLPMGGAASAAARYALLVLAAPRNLLSVARHNRLEPAREDDGWLKEELGFSATPATPAQPFVRFHPDSPGAPPSTTTTSTSDSGAFARAGFGVAPYHLAFLRATVALLEARKVPFALLNVPTYDVRRSDRMVERVRWSELLGTNVDVIGFAPATLFRGMPDAQVRLLYYNPVHLNANGAEYFTRAFLPALLFEYRRDAR